MSAGKKAAYGCRGVRVFRRKNFSAAIFAASSPLGILTVVAIGEGRRHALAAPDAFAGMLRIIPELLVAVGEVAIDRGPSGIGRRIVAVVDDSSRHYAEDELASLFCARGRAYAQLCFG